MADGTPDGETRATERLLGAEVTVDPDGVAAGQAEGAEGRHEWVQMHRLAWRMKRALESKGKISLLL